MTRGHIPLRSCIVCSTKTDKRDLIRLVRSQSGQVMVDTTGKTPGRGAYLCQRKDCWESALKKNRLDYRLKGPISSEDRLLLQQFATQIAQTAQE